MKLYVYSSQINDALSTSPALQENIDRAVETLQKREQMIFTAGNGGSAASASHFTQDLMNACNHRSVCLSDSVSGLTAIANDYGYRNSFDLPFLNLRQDEDIVFVISGSGNSENIINLVRTANAKYHTTIGLVGFDGGIVSDLVDICIYVPLMSMRMVESAHSVILHYIIERLA